MTYQLVMLDFDGTLADSFPFFVSVFNTIADQHAFRRIDIANIDSMRHLTPREVMARVGMPLWKLPMVSKTFIGMMKDSAHHIRMFDGVEAALRALAACGIQLAIVSSNSEANIRHVLGPDLAGLIARFECGMSIFGKAARLRQVARELAVDLRHAIYIGDQGTDAEAARKAGVAFGAVSWGYAPIDALRAFQPQVEFTTPAAMAHLAT